MFYNYYAARVLDLLAAFNFVPYQPNIPKKSTAGWAGRLSVRLGCARPPPNPKDLGEVAEGRRGRCHSSRVICLFCLKTIPVEFSRSQGNLLMKNRSLENPLSTPICLFPLLGGNKQFAFPVRSQPQAAHRPGFLPGERHTADMSPRCSAFCALAASSRNAPR
jgi:hypothetical protein